LPVLFSVDYIYLSELPVLFLHSAHMWILGNTTLILTQMEKIACNIYPNNVLILDFPKNSRVCLCLGTLHISE
jgi:hypothetical protein